MTDEQKVIKLSPEQILEKEVTLEKTKMNLELTALEITHLERALKLDLPTKTTQITLNDRKKQLALHEHNITALSEQVTKGEM
jgi:hypothetical protein